jgi:SAM-dependent methyltransferase
MYDRIASFFDLCCDEYGATGWAASAWASAESQREMYYVLSRVGLSGTVLDVGCGQGDYYDFLSRHHPHVEYTGIDISPKMLLYARERHPEVAESFHYINLVSYEKKHDWVIGAGPFNFRVGDHDQQFKYISEQITKMFELANKGMALSLLAGLRNEEIFPDLYYYNPAAMMDFCLGLTSDVVVDHATMGSQFAIYLLK